MASPMVTRIENLSSDVATIQVLPGRCRNGKLCALIGWVGVPGGRHYDRCYADDEDELLGRIDIILDRGPRPPHGKKGVRSVAIETRCRLCGEVIFPSSEDIRRGPHVWRLCTRCRPPDAKHPYALVEERGITS